MEIGNFKDVGSFGYGKLFDLYCRYCNSDAVCKQQFIADLQFVGTYPGTFGVFGTTFIIDRLPAGFGVNHIKRVPARANNLFTVDMDMIPFFGSVSEKP